MAALRILIADDHEVVRLGVRVLVEAQPGWLVCAEATGGPDAIEKARSLAPDVAILGLGIHGLNGVETTRRIRETAPGTEVLILTTDGSEERAREAVEAGARGYILKSDAWSDIATAVRTVAQHQPYFTSSISAPVPAPEPRRTPSAGRSPAADHLTTREREVVRLLAEGNVAREVARRLGISRKTVQAHRANVARKLQFRSLSDLIRYAIRNGLTTV